MTLPNISGAYGRLKQRIEADRLAVRIVRLGLLAIAFLLMVVVAFYAIDRWHTPEMPAGEDATDMQKGLYALLGAGLISALAVTAIAAWHPLRDATPIHRKRWFCPLTAGALAVGIFCVGYIFLGVYPVGGKSILTVDLHHQYAPLLSELRYMLVEGKLDKTEPTPTKPTAEPTPEVDPEPAQKPAATEPKTEAPTEPKTEAPTKPATEPEPQEQSSVYIGNGKTKKLHYNTCSSVNDMNPENMVALFDREEAIARGYEPCKRCNP